MQKIIKYIILICLIEIVIMYPEIFIYADWSSWSEWHSITNSSGNIKSCLKWSYKNNKAIGANGYDVQIKFINACPERVYADIVTYYYDTSSQKQMYSVTLQLENNQQSDPYYYYMKDKTPDSVSLIKEEGGDSEIAADSYLKRKYELPENIKEKKLRKECENGDMESCYDLASHIFYWGNRAEYSLLKKKACEGGFAQACHDIAILEKEEGNLEEAQRYFDKACNAGMTSDCTGNKQISSDIEIQEDDKTIAQKGCENGNMEDCYNLGVIENDAGNIERAKSLWNKACNGGYMMACNNLGVLEFRSGNYDNAERLYKKACSEGINLACDNLVVLDNKRRDEERIREEERKKEEEKSEISKKKDKKKEKNKKKEQWMFCSSETSKCYGYYDSKSECTARAKKYMNSTHEGLEAFWEGLSAEDEPCIDASWSGVRNRKVVKKY